MAMELREYLEVQIGHERELRERALADASRALEIQAKEYERRLELLNGAHERTERTQARMEALYLTREAHEAYVRSRAEADERQREQDLAWKRAVNQTLDEARGAANRQAAILALVLAAFGLLLRFLPG